jgi:cyclopropane-fatty-acyl-phospholipid synthase
MREGRSTTTGVRQSSLSRTLVERLFARADVTVNGDRPWDPQVIDSRFFAACVTRGTLGFGEAYMAGWWTCDDLEELVYRLSRHRLHQIGRAVPLLALVHVGSRLQNKQTLERAMAVADRHYNLGNDVFFAFLGKHRNYSIGLFEGTNALDEAQTLKMGRICRLLELSERDHLLDVGGGWGHLAQYAATNHGCRVTSINIADEQIGYARQLCHGLPVEIRKCDYREIEGLYTKAAVVAMFTHVGHKNHRTFFKVLHRSLVPSAKVLMESVGSDHSNTSLEPWTERYIFPGGLVPSLRQIDRASRSLFSRDYTSEFGAHYVLTLRAWHFNLLAAWPELSAHYPESIRRMFEYFFLSVAGTFRAERLRHWHIVMRKVNYA